MKDEAMHRSKESSELLSKVDQDYLIGTVCLPILGMTIKCSKYNYALMDHIYKVSQPYHASYFSLSQQCS
jgi:hypothetical protein